MQVKKVVVSSIVGVGMGAVAFAGATGTASADNSNWTPGKGGWQPGAGLATLSANVKVANDNFNGALSHNLNGAKILSPTLNVLNGAKILSGNKLFNGNFSNNILNSGANSFNTTTIKDSYNTHTVTLPAPKKKHGGNFSYNR